MNFHSSVLQPNPTTRQSILTVLDAALAAVDPKQAVHNLLRRTGDHLIFGERTYALDDFHRIFVLGAGKAGAPMAQGMEELLGAQIAEGLVVVKQGHVAPTRYVELMEAGHPVPNAAGVAAGQRILDFAHVATQDDLVVVLLSGGGSALLVAPADGLTLTDIQAMTASMLACGATINEINCLRKHCSGVKGGQLARAVAPATLITLALSDVIGSPMNVIASGPTVPDASTWHDAWAIVERYRLVDKLPPVVVTRLQTGLRGELPDTPKAIDSIFAHSQAVVVADNFVAAAAARLQAEALGYNTLLLTTSVEGEAQEVAKVAVALGKEVRASGQPVPAPACLILGGETTVQLGEDFGCGGRNQELALAAALALDGMEGITVVSLATDGTDGPTDSAGGIVDGHTLQRGAALQMSAERYLRQHNAYPYLQATNDLLVTGPTHTNVNDLIFVFIEP